MTAALPALGLVVLGVAVAVAGLTTPVDATAATGPIGALIVPASREFARSVTVGIGGLQALGGVALAASGWSR